MGKEFLSYEEIKKTINPVINKSDEYQQKLNNWRDLYSSIKETKE